ncbi:MAG: hypothetical protein H8E46_05365 [FCB group bacterium]|nr:hypothetical protein [FCB group bacterium]
MAKKEDKTKEERTEQEQPIASEEEVKEETVETVEEPQIGEEPKVEEEPVFEEAAAETKTEAGDKDQTRVKWLAALAYLPLICLIPLFMSRDDEFIQKHAKQGFILFLIEIIAMLMKIDAIWNLIIIICLAAAVVGVLGILIRGEVRIPVLADLAERLRI